MGVESVPVAYIGKVVKKARDKMGWVLRMFQLRKRSHIQTYLKSIVKKKVFYGQEPSGESTTTEYGVNYQLLAVIY